MLTQDFLAVVRAILAAAARAAGPEKQVWYDVEAKVTACRGLELLVSLHRDTALSHQATDAPMTDIKTQPLQLFRHIWAMTCSSEKSSF